EPDDGARRFLRDGGRSHPRQLQELLLSARTLAVLRSPACQRRSVSMAHAAVPSSELTEQNGSQASDLEEILRGLRQPQKSLSPKFFYDERGSQLFDRITKLPEYYLTR